MWGKKYEEMTTKCIKNRELINEVGNLESHGVLSHLLIGIFGNVSRNNPFKEIKQKPNAHTKRMQNNRKQKGTRK